MLPGKWSARRRPRRADQPTAEASLGRTRKRPTGNELISARTNMPGACMHLIPQSASHFHLLVSIFPSIGLIFVLGFYVTAFATDNAAAKRICLVLFGVLGLLAIPTYVSGDRSMAVLSQDPKISQELMSIQYGWGVTTLA